MKKAFPFAIAAKMARDIKTVSQNEAGEFVSKTVRLKDLCDKQESEILELKKELNIAEQTVRLLQIEEC